MSATIQIESGNLYVCRVSGILKRSEFGAARGDMAREIDAGAQPRLLAIFENVEGWERDAGWNDLDFLFSHSHKIAKIAILGEPRWEAEALAFAGAGFRLAPVKFFPLDQQAEARAWLSE
jgi:hypothetical protein